MTTIIIILSLLFLSGLFSGVFQFEIVDETDKYDEETSLDWPF